MKIYNPGLLLEVAHVVFRSVINADFSLRIFCKVFFLRKIQLTNRARFISRINCDVWIWEVITSERYMAMMRLY